MAGDPTEVNLVWKCKWSCKWVLNRVWEAWWLKCSQVEGSVENCREEGRKESNLSTCKGIANDEGHLPGCSRDDERGYTYRETRKWLGRFGPLGQKSCLWSKSRPLQLPLGVTPLSSPVPCVHHQLAVSHSNPSVPSKRLSIAYPKAWISSFKSR